MKVTKIGLDLAKTLFSRYTAPMKPALRCYAERCDAAKSFPS